MSAEGMTDRLGEYAHPGSTAEYVEADNLDGVGITPGDSDRDLPDGYGDEKLTESGQHARAYDNGPWGGSTREAIRPGDAVGASGYATTGEAVNAADLGAKRVAPTHDNPGQDPLTNGVRYGHAGPAIEDRVDPERTVVNGEPTRGQRPERVIIRDRDDRPPTPEPAPEAPRVVPHGEIDNLLKEVLRSGGEIPANVQMHPADLAVVHGAVAILRDNLSRISSGSGESGNALLRAMPSDQEVVASMGQGANLANTLALHRKLEQGREDPRARRAREAAYSAMATTNDTGTSTLEAYAASVARQVYGDACKGQSGAQLAPYLAGYAVQLAGASHRDAPELVAGTVLGFDHSCDVAQTNLKSHPQEFHDLRVRIRGALREAADQVQEEVEGASIGRDAQAQAKLAAYADRRVQQLVVESCDQIGADYCGHVRAQKAEAIEAAKAAEAAKAREVAAEDARIERLRAATNQVSVDYNLVAGYSPSTLNADITEALAHRDWRALEQRVAALIEHQQEGTPGTERILGRVWPRVESAIIGHAHSLREGMRSGVVPPEVALIVDHLDPSRFEDPRVAAQVRDLWDVLSARSATYYHPGCRVIGRRSNSGELMRLDVQERNGVVSYDQSQLPLMRTGYAHARLNQGAEEATGILASQGHSDEAATLDRMRSGRLTYVARVTEGVDTSDQSGLPPRLRTLIDQARQHVVDQAARHEAEIRAGGFIGRAAFAVRRWATENTNRAWQ